MQRIQNDADARRELGRGGFALLINGAATAFLGLAYWLVAARLFSSVEVGRGSSLISALLTISGLAQLNYGRSLAGLLPRAGKESGSLLKSVYIKTAVVSTGLGAAFVVIFPRVSNSLAFLQGRLAFGMAFVLAVPIWTLFTLEDTALTAFRQSRIIPFENAGFGSMKLLLLWALGVAGVGLQGFAVFLSWVAPLLLVIIPINVFLFRRVIPAVASMNENHDEGSPTRWVRYDFVGNILWLLGTMPLPVIALGIQGPRMAAAFYVPFTIVNSIDVVSINMGNVLTAEAARARGKARSEDVRFMGAVWLLMASLTVVIVALAPFLLRFFGTEYEASGTGILRLLLLAVLPRSVFLLSAARARGLARGRMITLFHSLATAGTLGIGLPLVLQLGTIGLALGWLVGSMSAAVVAIVFNWRLHAASVLQS